MKRRIAVAAAVFLIFGVFLCPVMAWDFHVLCSGRRGESVWFFLSAWRGILQEGTALRVYIIFQCAILCFVVWGVVSSTFVKYRSGMYLVQPGDKNSRIEIPLPAGQGQFGTAWFTPRTDMGDRYDCARISEKKDMELQALLEAGAADRKEVDNANITID